MKTGKALGLIIVFLVSIGAVSADAAYYYSTQWGNSGYLYNRGSGGNRLLGQCLCAGDRQQQGQQIHLKRRAH